MPDRCESWPEKSVEHGLKHRMRHGTDQIELRTQRIADWFKDFLCLIECSCVAPNDATHVLQMKMIRKGPSGWHNQEGEETTDLLGSGGDKLAIPPHNLGGAFERPKQWYWKADFFNELSDEAIAQHVEHGSKIPTLLSTMHLYPINGKAHQVARSATPWSYREAVWAEVIVGGGSGARESRTHHLLGKRLLGGIAPVLGGRSIPELHHG